MEAGVVITHPNRNTPATNSARALVIGLFGVSIALMVVILAFGWSVLEGMFVVSFGYILVYAVLIWRVSQWARGPLAVGAALAILLAIFAAIAFPTWGGRDAAGYAEPEAIWGSTGLSPGVIGILTLLLVLLQVAVLVACVRAFRQEWQVELEVPAGGTQGTSTGEGLPAEDGSGFDLGFGDSEPAPGDTAGPDSPSGSRDVW